MGAAFDLLSVGSLVFLVAAALLVWELYCRRQPARLAAKRLPGKRIYPLFENLLEGRKLTDAASCFSHSVEMAQTFKRGYRFVLFNKLHYWPILGHEVEFLFNSTKHSDKSFFYSFLQPMMGEGLLISNGAKWAHRRRILTPAFHFNILQSFLGTFRRECEEFVANLSADGEDVASKPEGADIGDLISRFTLNNICETAMGVKLSGTADADNYRHLIYRSGELLLKRYMQPLLFNDTIFSCTPIAAQLRRSVRGLHAFSGSVIEQRRSAYRQQLIRNGEDCRGAGQPNFYEKNRYAMLDTLLEAERMGEIDATGIQEEVDTFMFEGHDTTSTGLGFCFFTLGTHADAQQRCHDEIAALVREQSGAADGNGSLLSIHDYNRLPYLDQVIKETFRLFPPVPYIVRQLIEPVDIGQQVTLPVGTQVHVMIYNLHRDPAQWPDPERFDPDRFLPAAAERRHPFAYVPFSAGTRNCIGQKFAMLEIKALLVRLLLAYRLETVTRRDELTMVSDLVLRTEQPIRVRFVKRNGAE